MRSSATPEPTGGSGAADLIGRGGEMNHRWNCVALSALLIFGCKAEVPMTEQKNCLPQGADAAMLTDALSKHAVPHVYDADERCIYSSFEYDEKIETVKLSLFGEPPPPGLSVSWGDRNDELEGILRSNDIEIEKYVHHEIEYFAWSYEDHQRVERLLEFEPWKKDMYEEFRKSQ